ncbi:MAG: hypothetical protein ABJA76_15030 [Mucilaginibacter sp.]
MKIFIAAPLFLITFNCFSQLKTSSDFNVHNRTLTIANDKGVSVMHLSEADNDGVAWLTGAKFTNGNIELDIKGKDVLQHSFVGVAFHGVNDSTFDCIYFRPFNFRAADAIRKVHAVQYISCPKYDWERLRTDFPGKYEKGLATPPAPNGWFHARINVNGKKISVFVNDASAPSLEVEQIVPADGSMIGFWVGNTSGGDFKNLKVSK